MKTNDYLKPWTGVILIRTEQLFCFSTTSSTTEDFVIEDDETDDLF